MRDRPGPGPDGGAATRPAGTSAGRKDVNLFEPGLLARDRRIPSWSLPAAALATLLVGGAVVAWQQAALGPARQRTATLEARAKQLRDAPPAVGASADVSIEAEIARLRAQLAQLAGGADGPAAAAVLEALAAATIDGVWLTRIRVDREGGAVSLEGRTRDARLLPRYLQSLGRQPVLAGLALATVEAGRSGAPAATLPQAVGSTTATASSVTFRIVSASAAPRPVRAAPGQPGGPT